MLYVLLFSTVITLILTALQLFIDYKNDISRIHERISHMELSNIPSLSSALWTVDEQAVKLQAEGMLKLPDIARITITSPSKKIIFDQFSDEPITDNNIIKYFSLNYWYKNTEIDLGTLSITATFSNVYERLWLTFLIILFTQGIKTFLVSAFIMLIVYRLITQHLIKISENTQTFNLYEKTSPLKVINNSHHLFFKNNEIQTLSKSVNQMQNNISNIYTELKLKEEMLSKSQHLSHTASWYMNLETQKVYWSETVFELLHKKDRQLTLDDFYLYIPEKFRKELTEQINKLEINGNPTSLKHELLTDNGSHLTVEHQVYKYSNHVDNKVYLLGSINDITAHEYYQKELEYMANFDSLTHLPNRVMLHKYSTQLIDENIPFVLCILDLDGFKEVNDSIGHQSGDQLLQMIKPRLENIIGPNDLIARLGGDEFAFLIRRIGNMEHCYKRLNQLREAIKQPFTLDSIKVQIDGSFGLAKFPEQARDTITLLRFADVAMYHAKQNKEGFSLYDCEFDMYSPRRLSLINDLSIALGKQQFSLYYQPKITLHDGKLCSVEALIRWNHPEYGLVFPDEFIPLVEISDIIHSLTPWVIEQAIKDTIQFGDEENFSVAVNISTRNLQDIEFVNKVKKILEHLNCSASVLQLEITESAIMNDPDTALSSIKALVAMGVSISVDDFGTGYSSLSYLKNLPVSEIKIDKSFVMHMDANNNDLVIVRSTIDLAHNLGLKVVAEGIESLLIMEKLKSLNCDKGQGYHIAKPMTHKKLIEWILNNENPNALLLK